jgi:hypothetical protein
MAGKQIKPVMGIENFVRGAHKRDQYEMPDNFMTDFREILVYFKIPSTIDEPTEAACSSIINILK